MDTLLISQGSFCMSASTTTNTAGTVYAKMTTVRVIFTATEDLIENPKDLIRFTNSNLICLCSKNPNSSTIVNRIKLNNGKIQHQKKAI